eukprot:3837580-Amphidinium_carterae.1
MELGEIFRTDAKGEEGRIVLGGWRSADGTPERAKWFSIEIKEVDAPWLFKGSQGHRTIASGELLATLVGCQVFLPEGPIRRGLCRVSAATDNKGNSFVVKKLISQNAGSQGPQIRLAVDS